MGESSNQRPTIKAIAERAGVSRGTVDRVIHDRPNINPRVKRKILQVMEEMDYTPNLAARALASNGKKKTIALVYPSWTGYFRDGIERGVGEAMKEYSMFGIGIRRYMYNQLNNAECLDILDGLIAAGVDGLAICTEDNPRVVEKINGLVEAGMPVVTFNSDVPGSHRACFVGQDTLKSGRVAAEILSKYLTHEEDRVLVVLGNYEYRGHKERVDGFVQRFEELGIQSGRYTVSECYNKYSVTHKNIKVELEKDENIRFIYMANSSLPACVDVLEELGRVGKVRIVCHDITAYIGSLMRKGIVDFTIDQNFFDQGFRSIALLAEQLLGNGGIEREFEHTSLDILNAENLMIQIPDQVEPDRDRVVTETDLNLSPERPEYDYTDDPTAIHGGMPRW